MDFGIAEARIARGSPPGTTTEVLRFGVPFAEIRVVSVALVLLALHDPVDAAQGTVLMVIVEATSELQLLALSMTLVDVAAEVTTTSVLIEVGM
jgi:hypothetical protein